MNKTVLTIGAFDPTGGCGVNMDVRVFHNFKYYVASCVTGVFAKNTRTILEFHAIPFTTVGQQIEAIINDIEIDGLKIGFIPDVNVIAVIAELLKSSRIQPSLLDVSLIHDLNSEPFNPEVVPHLVTELFPKVDVVVCNIKEAGLILGCTVESAPEMKEAAEKLHRKGCNQVVITSRGQESRAMDVVHDGNSVRLADAARVITENTLGRGAVFTSCILGNMIKGDDLFASVSKAKLYIRKAMMHNFKIGKGTHPLNLNSPL